ncbi:MAG TPA: DUF3618 domain-containing protein [Caulobacteraceae bacterium]|jgi:hypothetical protein
MTRPAAELEVEVEAQRSRLEETADALKDKMTPGEVFEEASRAVGDAGQEVLARLLDQARRNPMAVAVVGAGLVWLMKSSDQDRGVAHAAREGARHFGRQTQDLGEDLGRRAHDMGQSLSRSTHDLQDQASERVSQVKEKVSDMKDQVGDAVAHAREAGRSAAGKVTSSAQNSAQLAQETGRWFGQIIEDVVREEPLILGAVGVAVGFAIGSALPRTSVEDQTLGQAHDSLVEKGREVVHETLEQAGNVAEAAYAAAREELRPAAESDREEPQPSRSETV